MNLEYLENLLIRAKELKLNESQVNVADDIKIKTSEAFKVLFPGEFVLAGEISRLNFKPRNMLSGGISFSRFVESKTKLVSTLEAKIEVLNHRGKKQIPGFSGPVITPELQNEKIETLLHKIKSLTAVNNNLEQKHEKNKLDLLEQIQLLKSDGNSKFESELKEAKRSRVFKDLAIGATALTIAFFLGLYFGTAKFDNDKINMAEKIRNQNITIDSLKKNASERQKWR